MKLYRTAVDDVPGDYTWFPTREAAEAEAAEVNEAMGPPLMRVEAVELPLDDPQAMCDLLNTHR